MPLFRRRRPDPPEWASFFDADAWHEFSELVRYETGRRGWPHDFELGIVVHAGATMGLGNVAQMCHGAPREEWTTIVARHFGTLDQRDTLSFEGPEQARAALRARLIDDEFLAGREMQFAERHVGDDLRLALAYDLPDTVHLPPRDEVLEWGDEDELFELALEQTRREPGLELTRHDYSEEQGGPTTIWLLTGDSFFTATHGLWADGFDPPPSEHGTLVAVPNRHAVLAHPIRDLDTVSAVGTMLSLHARIEPDHIMFAPSDELTDVLNSFE